MTSTHREPPAPQSSRSAAASARHPRCLRLLRPTSPVRDRRNRRDPRRLIIGPVRPKRPGCKKCSLHSHLDALDRIHPHRESILDPLHWPHQNILDQVPRHQDFAKHCRILPNPDRKGTRQPDKLKFVQHSQAARLRGQLPEYCSAGLGHRTWHTARRFRNELRPAVGVRRSARFR